jgi:hypothetical protein
MVNEGSPVGSDSNAAARSRVQCGPVPDWVRVNDFATDYRPEGDAQITFLLFDTQIHAERHGAFIHQAIRLEPMQAVQNWSQWRLQFEPKTQLITLHSLKIRRDGNEIDRRSRNVASPAGCYDRLARGRAHLVRNQTPMIRNRAREFHNPVLPARYYSHLVRY